MKIPIASQTMEELREGLRSLQVLDERINAGGTYRVHDYCAQLLDEISRLRAIEADRCRTTWHDHIPEDLPDRLELEELNQMMRGPSHG